MDIGVIGTGLIGGTVGTLLARAGHRVTFAGRDVGKARTVAQEAGPNAAAGTVEEAARFGPVVLLSVPLGALPAVAAEVAPLVGGKVVLDTLNPYPQRDGELAAQAVAGGEGSGAFTARHLPGARVVKAFNTVYFESLRSEAHRAGSRLAIPLAGDDEHALELAAALVADAGFDPVEVGPLARAAAFDVGTPLYNRPLTAAELRAALRIG